MRFTEFDYLTKGLPLILNKNVERNYYDESIDTLEKGTVVYFSEWGFDRSDLTVSLDGTDDNTVVLDSYDLMIDYSKVDNPNLNDLKEMEDEDLNKITVGNKLITGENENEMIGSGQVVEVTEVHTYEHQNGNKEFCGATVKDKFGNEERLYAFYHLTDNQVVDPYIVNPAKDILENGTTIELNQDNLPLFIKTLTEKIEREKTLSTEVREQDVLFALAQTLNTLK